MSVCCVSCFVVCCCVCAVLCYVLVCWCWCGVLLRVCACYVIWLCGVCFVCCCRPSGALGLLGLTEPHTGTSSAPAVPPASARCPLPPWYAWTAGLPVELDRCVGIRRSSRLRWTGARPLLAASRPLPPETSPISAGTRTWTPQEYDASAPSPS